MTAPPLNFVQPAAPLGEAQRAVDGSRVPYAVFHSQAIYDREQEHIFRGPTWSFLGLDGIQIALAIPI